MKRLAFIAVFAVSMGLNGADFVTQDSANMQSQNKEQILKISTNVSNKAKGKGKTDILRLIYPQWQGGDITMWFSDLEPQVAARGYTLGAYMLNLIVDSINVDSAHSKYLQNVAVVPIQNEFNLQNAKRIVQDGVIDKGILIAQTKEAFKILRAHSPSKVLTLGGECSVSIPVFSYLADKYNGEVAVIWIDAHPDLGIPHDEFYKGYHAMAVSALAGKGNLKDMFSLPQTIDSSRILLLGLHSKEAKHYSKRQMEFGIKSVNANEAMRDSMIANKWLANLQNTKPHKTKVMIHLDLDVLDPKELYVAVGDSGQMSLKQVSSIINNIANEYEIIGLTIAEHLPKSELKLKTFLESLPLIKP